MSALVSPSAASTRELVCESACETGSTRSSSSSTPTVSGAGDTPKECPTTLPGWYVGPARDPAARVSARLSPGHARGRGRRAGTAGDADRYRAHLHQPHLGLADAERERVGRGAARLRGVVRPRGARRRRLLPPHARGRRRHAGAHQVVAPGLVTLDPGHGRAPGARDLAGHLPVRAPRQRRTQAADCHFVGRIPLTSSIVPSGARMRSITDTRFSPASRRNSGSLPRTLLVVLRKPSSSWTFRNIARMSGS